MTHRNRKYRRGKRCAMAAQVRTAADAAIRELRSRIAGLQAHMSALDVALQITELQRAAFGRPSPEEHAAYRRGETAKILQGLLFKKLKDLNERLQFWREVRRSVAKCPDCRGKGCDHCVRSGAVIAGMDR